MSINWFSISRRKRQLLNSLLGDGTFRVSFDHESQTVDYDPTSGKRLRLDRPLQHLRDVWKTCAPQHLSVSASKPRIRGRKKLGRKRRSASAPGRPGEITSESSQEEPPDLPPDCSGNAAFLLGLDRKTTLGRVDLSDERRQGMSSVSRYVRLVDEAFREMEAFLRPPPSGGMSEVTTQLYNVGGEAYKMSVEKKDRFAENAESSKAYLASLIGLRQSELAADELIWEVLATNVVRYHAFCRTKLKEFLTQPLKETEFRLEGLQNSSRVEECGIKKAFQAVQVEDSRHKDRWTTLQNVVGAVKRVLDQENTKVYERQERQFQRNLANEIALVQMNTDSPEINQVSEKVKHVTSHLLTVQANVLEEIDAMGRRIKRHEKMPALEEDLTRVLSNTTRLVRELNELCGWVCEDGNMRQIDIDMEAGESTRDMKQVERGEEHLRQVLQQDKKRKERREKITDGFQTSRNHVSTLGGKWNDLLASEEEIRKSIAKKKADGERRVRTIQELCELSGLESAVVEKATHVLRPTEAEEPAPKNEDGVDMPPPPQPQPKPVEEGGSEKRKVYTNDERLVQAHAQCLQTVKRREAHVLRQKTRAEEGLAFKLDRTINKEVQREMAEKDELDRQKRNDMIKQINDAKELQLKLREKVQASRMRAKKELERWQLMLDIEGLKTTLQHKQDEYEKNEKKKHILETEVQELHEVMNSAASTCMSLKMGQWRVHPKSLKLTQDPLDGQLPEECREQIAGLVGSYLRSSTSLPERAIDSFLHQASEASTLMASSLASQGLHGAVVSERLRRALGRVGQKNRAARSGAPGIRKDKETADKSAWELSWLEVCDGMGPRSCLLRRTGSSYFQCLDDVVYRIGILEPKRIDPLPRYYDGTVEFGQQLPMLERAAERMLKYWQEAKTMKPNPASKTAVKYLGQNWRNGLIEVARSACHAVHALRYAIKATSTLQKAAGSEWEEARETPFASQASASGYLGNAPGTRPVSRASSCGGFEPELRAYARGCVLKRVYWALATWFNNLASVLEAMRHGVNLHNVVTALVGFHAEAAKRGGQFSCREQTYRLTKIQVAKLLNVVLGGVKILTRLGEELQDVDLRPAVVINDLVDSVAAARGLTSSRPPQLFYIKNSNSVIEGTLYPQLFAHEKHLSQQYNGVMELLTEGLGDLEKSHMSQDDIITDCCQGLSWLLRFWWLEVNLLVQVSHGGRFQKWRAKMRAHFMKEAQDIRRSRTHKFPEELARFEGYKPKLPTAAQLEDWQAVLSAERFAMMQRLSYVQRTAMLWCLGEEIFLAPFEPVLLEDCRPRLFQDSLAGRPVCWGFAAITDLDLELRVLLGAFDRGRNYAFEDLVASIEALLYEKEEAEKAQIAIEEQRMTEEALSQEEASSQQLDDGSIDRGSHDTEQEDSPLSEFEGRSQELLAEPKSELQTPALSRAASVSSRVSIRDTADVQRMRSPAAARNQSLRGSQASLPSFAGQKKEDSLWPHSKRSFLAHLPTEEEQEVMDEHSATIVATHDEHYMVETLKDEEHKLGDLVAEFKKMDVETQNSEAGLQMLAQVKQSAFTLKNDLECVVADVSHLDQDDAFADPPSLYSYIPITINVVDSEANSTLASQPVSRVETPETSLVPQEGDSSRPHTPAESVRSLKRNLAKKITARRMQPIAVEEPHDSERATPISPAPQTKAPAEGHALIDGLQELQDLVGANASNEHEHLAEAAGEISAILKEVDHLLTGQDTNVEASPNAAEVGNSEETVSLGEQSEKDDVAEADHPDMSRSLTPSSPTSKEKRKTVLITDETDMPEIPGGSREECEEHIEASSAAAKEAQKAAEEITDRMERSNGQIAMTQERLICAHEGRPPYSSDPVERKHHVDTLKLQLADYITVRTNHTLKLITAIEQASTSSEEAVEHGERLIRLVSRSDTSQLQQSQEKLLDLQMVANKIRRLPLAVYKRVLEDEVKMQQWCQDRCDIIENPKNDKLHRALAASLAPLLHVQKNIGIGEIEIADTPEKRLQQLESQKAILEAEATIVEAKICESEMAQSVAYKAAVQQRLEKEGLSVEERQQLESRVGEIETTVIAMDEKLAPLKVDMVVATSKSLREKNLIKDEVQAKKRASLYNAISGGNADDSYPSAPPTPVGLALISPDVTSLQFHHPHPAAEDLKSFTDKMLVREQVIADHIVQCQNETARQVAQLSELAKVEEALKAEVSKTPEYLASIQAARKDILENVQNLEKEQRQLAEDRVHALKAIAGSKHDRALALQEKLAQKKLNENLTRGATPGTRTPSDIALSRCSSRDSARENLPDLQEDVTERMELRHELLELEAESEIALKEANVLILDQLQSEADTAQELEKMLESSEGVTKDVLEQAREASHQKQRAVIEGRMAQLAISKQFITKKVEMAKQNRVDLQGLARVAATHDQLEQLPEDAPSLGSTGMEVNGISGVSSPKQVNERSCVSSPKLRPESKSGKRKSVMSEAVLRRTSLVAAAAIDSSRRDSVCIEVIDLLKVIRPIGASHVDTALSMQNSELNELQDTVDTIVEESLVEEVNLCHHDLRHAERKAQDTSSEVRKFTRQVTRMTVKGREPLKHQVAKAVKHHQKKAADSELGRHTLVVNGSQKESLAETDTIDLSEPAWPTDARKTSSLSLKGTVRTMMRNSKDLTTEDNPLAKLQAAIGMTINAAQECSKDVPAMIEDINDEDAKREEKLKAAAQEALKAAKSADKVNSIEVLHATIAAHNAEKALEQHRLSVCERKLLEMDQRIGDIKSGAINNDTEDPHLRDLVSELQAIETEEEKHKLEAQAETIRHAISELDMRNQLSEHRLQKLMGTKSPRGDGKHGTPKAKPKANRHKYTSAGGKRHDELIKRFLVGDEVAADDGLGTSLPYSNFSKPKKTLAPREKYAAKHPEVLQAAEPRRSHLKGNMVLRNKPKDPRPYGSEPHGLHVTQEQHVPLPRKNSSPKPEVLSDAVVHDDESDDSKDSAADEDESSDHDGVEEFEAELSTAFIRKVRASKKLVDVEEKSIARKRATIGVLEEKLQELESADGNQSLRSELVGLLELEEQKLEEAEQKKQDDEMVFALQRLPFFSSGWHMLGGKVNQRLTWTAMADKVHMDVLLYQCFECWRRTADGDLTSSSDGETAPGRKKVSFLLPGDRAPIGRKKKKALQNINFADMKSRHLLGRKALPVPRVHHSIVHTFEPSHDHVEIGERPDLGRIMGISLQRLGESDISRHASVPEDAQDHSASVGTDSPHDEVIDDDERRKKASRFSMEDAEKLGWRFSVEAKQSGGGRRCSSDSNQAQEIKSSNDSVGSEGVDGGVWPQSWQSDRDGIMGNRGTPRDRSGGPPSSAGSGAQISERRHAIPTLPPVTPRSESGSVGRDWFLEYASAATAAKVNRDIMSSEGFRHSSPRFHSSYGDDFALPPLVPNRPTETMVLPKILGMDIVNALHNRPPEFFQDGRLFSESYIKRRLVDLTENHGKSPRATQWTQHGHVAKGRSNWKPISQHELEANTRRVIEESTTSFDVETGRAILPPREASAPGYLPQGTNSGYPMASPTALAVATFLHSPPKQYDSSASLAHVSTVASLGDLSVAQAWKECLREVKPRKVEALGHANSKVGLESMTKFSGSRRKGAPDTADDPCNGMSRHTRSREHPQVEVGYTPRPAKAPRFLASEP